MPTLSAEELKELESMDEDEAYEMMKKIAAMSARAQLPNEAEAEEEADHLVAEQYHKLVNRSTPMEYRRLPSLLRFEQPKVKAGFMAMGEEPTDMIEDAEFNEDEMPTMAHSQLQQHREYREYYRVAAWEMPLLTSKYRIRIRSRSSSAC
jgi:small subunit ribosomal protein S35